MNKAVHVGNQDREREAREDDLREKSYWSSTGWPTGSYGYDGYPNVKPSPLQLVKAYSDIVFSCTSLIASKVADVPIHLYVSTHSGQQRPKCLTAPLSRKNFHVRQKQRGLGSQVEEVIDHPALDLLRRCNSVQSKKDLLGQSQLFLDLAGNAFWLLKFDPSGYPCKIFLLPTQYVQPVRDVNQMVTSWVVGTGQEQMTYTTREVIHFREWNPEDVYGLGKSPVEAAWARIQLGQKELKYLDSTLTNQGRPDTVIAIRDSINPVESERLQKEWHYRNSQGLNGGPIVVDGTMSVAPLSYPPKDLAELELYKVIKTNICNALGVPPELLELGTSNRATADAILYSLAENCLKPRVNRLVETLNERLLPFFDDTGRLFFEADSVVPADKEHDLAETQMLLGSQVITRSECRVMYGFAPEPWADEPLLPSGVVPVSQEEEEPAPAPVEPPPVDRAQYASGLANVQVTYYAGQIPRDAAVALVISTYGYSPREAQALFPDVPPAPPQPETPTPAPPAPEPPAPPEKAKAVDVPDERQATTYDCGPAAVMSVCQHFHVECGTEEDLIAQLGTTPEQGTSPEAICSYLTKAGLDVTATENMSLEDLATLTGRGCPVICAIQSYGTPAQEQASQSGHYVVVTDINDQAVSIQDPSAGAKDVPLAEWMQSWHDQGHGEEYTQLGIAVGE